MLKRIRIEKVKIFISYHELVALWVTTDLYLEKQILVGAIRIEEQLIHEASVKVLNKLHTMSASNTWLRHSLEPDKLRSVQFPITSSWIIYKILSDVSEPFFARLRGNLEEILKKYPELQLH